MEKRINSVSGFSKKKKVFQSFFFSIETWYILDNGKHTVVFYIFMLRINFCKACFMKKVLVLCFRVKVHVLLIVLYALIKSKPLVIFL